MKISISILLLLGWVFIPVFNSSAITMHAEADPEIAPGLLEIGQPFTVDIYMDNNDGTVYGYSMPLAFYSPDEVIVNYTHRDVGGAIVSPGTSPYIKNCIIKDLPQR